MRDCVHVPLHVDALDLRFAVHGMEPSDAADVKRLWAPVAAARDHRPARRIDVTVSSSGDEAVAVTGDGGRWTGAGPAAATAAVNAALNVTAVTGTGHLALHAGVVSSGSVLLALPGASGRGKSTLVCALVALGWRYVSDEALVLRWDDGSVVPYPRPVALSPWSWAAVGGEERWASVVAGGEHLFLPTGPDAATAAPEGARAAVDVLLVPERAPEPGLEPLRRVDALAEMVRRSFTLHRRAAEGHALLGDVVRRAEVGRLLVGDPVATAAFLDDVFR